MAEGVSTTPRFKTRNLLGVLPFLWRYPRAIALTVGILLVIISIELTLPQIIGRAVSDLRMHLRVNRSLTRGCTL
jgi:hypothetical protein